MSIRTNASRVTFSAGLALAGLLAFAPVADAATITIVNLDGAGEGFNDPTVVAPVGGNPGTTVGEQRLNVALEAAQIWGAILPSNVEIRVRAQFNPQSCNASSAVLASAGALQSAFDFPLAPFTNTNYHIALANKIANQDLSPGVDDIQITFNSSIDNNNSCLDGTNYYYGLDGNEGGDIEMLPVALHELGHGLGFSDFVTLSNGSLLGGRPDIYMRQLFDNSTGKAWVDMDNAERAASAVNDGNVVWTGAAATFKAPFVLGFAPKLEILSPGSIQGSYNFGTAQFGPNPADATITADVVLADDGTGTVTDACEPLINGVDVNGKIALLFRGSCTFVTKALNAQNAGAVGVILVDNQIAATPPQMGGNDPTVTIPIVSVTNADGNTILAEIPFGVTATIGPDSTQRAGADSQDRVKVYAPNPVQGGSSISHWDVSAAPNLLMEPAINSNLSSDVDLTKEAFEDIGWLPQTTDAPPTIARALQLSTGSPNPFRTATTIQFTLARESDVRLSIYDISGRLVRELRQGVMPAGLHAVAWDGTDSAGNRIGAGVYLSVLRSGNEKQSRQIVFVK